MGRYLSVLTLMMCVGSACTEDKETVEDTGPAVESDTDTDTDTDSDTDTDTDTDADTDTDTDTGTVEDCVTTVDWIEPVDTTTPTPIDSVIRVGLSAAIAAEDLGIIIIGDAGEIDGVVTVDDLGTTATFTPDADLAYGSTYEISAVVCDELAQSSFITMGAPIESDTVEHKVYALDLADADWIAPEGMGALLPLLNLGGAHIMMYVKDVDTKKQTVDLVGAIGFPGDGGSVVQYPCAEPSHFPQADFSDNPYINAGPAELSLDTDFGTVPMYELNVSGEFYQSGEGLHDLRLSGLLDVRTLGIGTAYGCELLNAVGIPCEVCPDGVEECIYLDAISDVPAATNALFDPNLDPSDNAWCY